MKVDVQGAYPDNSARDATEIKNDIPEPMIVQYDDRAISRRQRWERTERSATTSASRTASNNRLHLRSRVVLKFMDAIVRNDLAVDQLEIIQGHGLTECKSGAKPDGA